MDRKILLLPIVFLILIVGVNAQISITNTCENKCENGILYTSGIYDDRARECIYKEIRCDYGCRSDKPECNNLPPNEAEAREMIYDEIENLKVDINVQGTEYQVGDSGTVFLQLVEDFYPIINGTCYLTLYYPNKTIFINRTLMSFISNSDGIYYHDFIVPNITGVYIASAVCEYPFICRDEIANFFVLDWGAENEGDFIRTWFFDTLYHGIREDRIGVGQPWFFNITYEFDLTNVNISKVYSIEVETFTDWHQSGAPNTPETENVYVKIYNFSSDTWLILPNQIIPTVKKTNLYTANIITLSLNPDIDFSHHINTTTNETWIGFSDVDQLENLQRGQFRANQILLTIKQTEEIPIQIRGSGEAHVSSAIPENLTIDISEAVWETFWLLGDPNEELVSNHDFCIDNQTLRKTITTEKCINSNCRTLVENRTIVCEYGCNDNACVLSPMFIWLIILIIIIVVILVAYFIGKEKVSWL